MSRAKPFVGPWCKNCGDAFDAPERPCPNPSPGEPYKDCGRGGHMFDVKSRVEVDALALMLDGAREYLTYRFGPANVRVLEAGRGHFDKRPTMKAALDYPEWAEVAKAILELEARADWWSRPDEVERPILPGAGLAYAALKEAARKALPTPAHQCLEAAAILRDGWRPRKRSKR